METTGKTMTHDELLSAIDVQIITAPPFALNGYTKFLHSLRAVVELHNPMQSVSLSGKPIVMCSGCYEEEYSHSDYPCPTIQAIEKELE